MTSARSRSWDTSGSVVPGIVPDGRAERLFVPDLRVFRQATAHSALSIIAPESRAQGGNVPAGSAARRIAENDHARDQSRHHAGTRDCPGIEAQTAGCPVRDRGGCRNRLAACRMRFRDRHRSRPDRQSHRKPYPSDSRDSKLYGAGWCRARPGGLCGWHLLGGCERGNCLGEAVVSTGG